MLRETILRGPGETSSNDRYCWHGSRVIRCHARPRSEARLCLRSIVQVSTSEQGVHFVTWLLLLVFLRQLKSGESCFSSLNLTRSADQSLCAPARRCTTVGQAWCYTVDLFHRLFMPSYDCIAAHRNAKCSRINSLVQCVQTPWSKSRIFAVLSLRFEPFSRTSGSKAKLVYFLGGGEHSGKDLWG